jgi:hypothetical protein
MGLFDTTAKEVMADRLKKAKQQIKSLQEWLERMDEEITICLGEEQPLAFPIAFPIAWGEEMMKKALFIFNEIARYNGASMVRSTK